ncbi:MAG: hypothetical protein JST30_13490 [Armatimonadetes bacterium]|nr:hypothetical protein [Armatimonadota bacterium]
MRFVWGTGLDHHLFQRGRPSQDDIILDRPWPQGGWPGAPVSWLAFLDNRERYDPRQIPNIHLDFTAEDVDVERVIKLASTYGPLGRYLCDVEVPTRTFFEEVANTGHEVDIEQEVNSRNPTVTVRAERVADWLAAVCKLKSLITLWNAACSTDAVSLALLRDAVPNGSLTRVKMPHPPPSGIRYHSFASLRSREWARSTLGHFLDKSDPHEWVRVWELDRLGEDERLRTITKFLVTELVNRELSDGASFTLDPVKPSRLRLAPVDLLGYLYLSFASQMAGGFMDWRVCPGCSEWFAATRPKQKCCSKSCRDKVDYRKPLELKKPRPYVSQSKSESD